MKKMKLLAILVLSSVVSFAGCKKDSVAKTYTLNVAVTNGTVVKNPDLAAYNSGATVQLTVTPNSGYTFNGWSGDATGTGNPKTVVMDGNKTVTATFLKQTVYTLTVACDPTAGGSVVMNPSGGAYVAETAVTMTATANSGYTFTGWSGDATSTGNPKNIVIDGNKTVTATFSPIVVNVKSKGAKGDGITDDTKAIQAAIDQVAGTGGTVLVPDGIYMIDAVSNWGINLKSNMTLSMTSGAILKAIPNSNNQSSVIMIHAVNNVNVIGGTVQGERYGHQGTTGEFGRGIRVSGGSSNILIERVTAIDAWGDGFDIFGGSSNVTLSSVIADNNRRNGLTIGWASGVLVQNSIFKNTHGTLPEAGIDVEPNPGASELTNNVRIINNEVFGNRTSGITSHGYVDAPITSLTVSGNNVHNNGSVGIDDSNSLIFIGIYNGTISGNNVHDNAFNGIPIVRSSIGNTVNNNTVTNNGGYGILLWENATGNTVTGNTATGNTLGNINDLVGGNTISGNTVGP